MQDDQHLAAISGHGDREIPLYARLGLQAGAAEWLRVALEQAWVHGSSPAVFISYCTKDEGWRFQLDRFLGPELARLSCPRTMEPYRPWSFASLEHGTATGTQFPVELASQLWRCRAAIVLLSQDYLKSPICAATELPFLAWRHVAQGMPLYVLQVGVVSAAAGVIPLPQVNGTWPDFDLNKQTNDRFPGLDHREQKLVRQPNIFELRKGPDRDRRLAAFAELVRGNLAEHHRQAGESKPLVARKPPDDSESANPPVRRTSVGAFPPIDRFEGRATERGLLAEALSHSGTGVVALCQIGGAGKTCLALKAIEDLLDKEPRPFEAIFQFTFYGGRSQDEFMRELVAFLDDVICECRPTEGVEAWLFDVLRRRAVLLLLDGMEVIQSSSLNMDVGSLQQGGVRTLLLWLCNQSGVRSNALVTSRLDLRDLLQFRGGRYQPIELPGLSLEDGVRVLQRQGVQASEPVLRQVVTELSGHPLGLMVFANSVQRVKTVRTNAAVVVLRKAALSDQGSLDAKLGRLLVYYQKAIDEADIRLIASVTVFPDGAPAEWLREVMAELEGKSKRAMPFAQLEERLDRLSREGILQAVPTLVRTEYTAHPVIRESFRAAASGLVETAAKLHLSARPSLFCPKTSLQAMPYVRAVEIYCENGNFSAADQVLQGHLEDGRALSKLGKWRFLFNLLWQFVQPDRREQCQSALGLERFAALLPCAIDACIALNEWEIAEDLCALSSGTLSPIQLARRQAKIHMNVGSLVEAERALRLEIVGASFLDRLCLEPELAEVLRLQGKLREAWRLLSDWIHYRPKRQDELDFWIKYWWKVSICSARLWSGVETGIAERFLNAMDKAKPVSRAFLEWERLQLLPGDRRSPDQWLHMLEFARILGDNAARSSTKEADGGWMVGILESLNGLRRHQDVLDNVPIVVSQLHERSSYRPSVDVEAGRAHLGLGRTQLARELAGRALKQALASRNVRRAGEAATLLLELPKVSAPSAIETLARQVVEAIQKDTPSDREFHLEIPLPGENGWDDHLATLIVECEPEGRRAWAWLRSDIPEELEEAEPTFNTALHLAAEYGIAGAVPAILARIGRAALFGDELFRTALMLAVRGGHTEVVRALLNWFGKLDFSDALQGAIALYAIEQREVEIVELMMSGGSNVTREWLSKALVTVARDGDESLFDLLLNNGADPTVADPNGNLPIVQAAEQGNIALLLRLVHLDSVSSIDANGRTALMAAAAQGHQRVIALLAEMNADINQLDHKGRSAADVASESGAIQSLINLGVFFGFPIDRDRHLLPAIKRAEHLGSDCGLRSLLIWLDSEAGRRLNSPDLKPKVRAALKRLATKSKLQPADTRLTSIKMNIGLTFNARGEFQLVHDRPFATTLHDQTFVATPLWVGYHIDRRTLEVVYDTGGTYPIDWYASDEMHKKLLQLRTILIIRMKDGEPVEGYNTSVLRLRDGIAIDEY